MRRFVRCGPFVLSSLLAFFAGPPCSAEKAAPSNERDLYELANSLLARKDYGAATEKFDQLLRVFPRSSLVAEAVYKIAVAQRLQGRSEESGKTFERLIREHFLSPWADLTLQVHLDDKQLFALAESQRKAGRKEDARSDALRALKLYTVYQERFVGAKQVANARGKEEIFYKLADCYRCAGEKEMFEDAMRHLVEKDKEGKWGKLAKLRLDADAFGENMDELIRLAGVHDENFTAFLDLSEKKMDGLDEADRVKCRYYRAHCYAALEEMPKAIEIRRRLLRDHPESSWAPECLLWLAEEAYGRKDYAAARKAYRRLVKRYPNSPRAAAAKRWAAWIVHQDKTTRELERALAVLINKLSSVDGNVALKFQATSERSRKTLEARLAYRDAGKFLFGLRYGDGGLAIASTEGGAWYRGFGQNFVSKSPQTLRLPMPHGEITYDPRTDKGNFQFGWSTTEKASKKTEGILKAPPEIVAYLTRMVAANRHIHEKVGKDAEGRKQVILYLESPDWEIASDNSVEIVLNSDHAIHQVRWVRVDEQGKKFVATLFDMTLGEELPEELLTVAHDENTRVQEVEELNPFELFANLMKLFAAIAEEEKLTAKQ